MFFMHFSNIFRPKQFLLYSKEGVIVFLSKFAEQLSVLFKKRASSLLNYFDSSNITFIRTGSKMCYLKVD